MSPKRIGVLSLVILILGVLTVVLVSCDAEQDALKLFSDQGLNLLRPARDYIQPGGMVFVVKGGYPEYDDPADPVVPENGNLTDFKAAILSETKKKTGAFSAALSLAKSIIPTPLSFGAGVESSRDVTLKGIDTTGLRLQTKSLDDLIQKPNTSKAAVESLQSGARVFIVQEIYKATSLNLQASDKKAFNLKFNDGTAAANCDQTSQPAKQDGTTPSKQSGAGSAGTAKDTSSSSNGGTTKNQDGGSPNTDKSKSAPQSGTSKSGTGGTDSNSPKQASNASQGGTPAVSGAVAVCVATDYSLQLQTKDPIPFAVRLAELELVQGVLQRRRGAKTFVGTLGEGGEISGSLVDDPVIQNMTRRKH